MIGDGAGYALALNSLPFLAFAAGTAAAFFVVPARARWLVAVAASLLFYAGWEALPAVAGLVALILAAHLSAVAIARFPARRRLACAAGLLATLGTLFALKYFNFFAAEATRLATQLNLIGETASPPEIGWYLPVGYSFVTFSLASYVIDVYRGKMAPAAFGDFAAYASFFPKILAGPIERAEHFLPQWRRRQRLDTARASEAVQLILWGLFKKVVIADRLSAFVDPAYATPAFATPVELIVATYFYAFQIYCDFSGYTDIAIGVCKLFGLDLAENFRRPYLSRSIQEFWTRRWHVTLATWFRDYLYIPLGGSRVRTWRTMLNVMTVFVVSGIWHAGITGTAVSWSFAIWGALNGFYQIASLAMRPITRWLGARLPGTRRIVASGAVHFLQALAIFHLITFTWIFFRAASIADALTVIERIGANLGQLPMLIRFYDATAFDFLASLALIAFLLCVEVFLERKPLAARLAAAPTPVRWGYYYVTVLALVILGKWGTGEFIYMQF